MIDCTHCKYYFECDLRKKKEKDILNGENPEAKDYVCEDFTTI